MVEAVTGQISFLEIEYFLKIIEKHGKSCIIFVMLGCRNGSRNRLKIGCP